MKNTKNIFTVENIITYYFAFSILLSLAVAVAVVVLSPFLIVELFRGENNEED